MLPRSKVAWPRRLNGTRQALSIDPNKSMTLGNLGNARAALGDIPGALQALTGR